MTCPDVDLETASTGSCSGGGQNSSYRTADDCSRSTQQQGPSSWPDDTIRHEAVIALELANVGFGDCIEDPVSGDADLALKFFDQIACCVAPQCGSPRGIDRGYD